jgi:hypothetical protein
LNSKIQKIKSDSIVIENLTFMKNLLSFIVLLSLSSSLNSQITIDKLDFNNVSATILDEGALFYSQPTGLAGYEIPKLSGNRAIYAASLWMAGIDENGILRNACTKYNTGNDYYSGPFSSMKAYLDTNYLAKYDDAIWTVLKSDIDYHRDNFMQSGYVLSLIHI